ncbi:MAG TPA: universal stress protein [Candidatus Binatia bacterium]|jgi:nucleotide-binding universal stress UspA family protein
MYTRILIPLDGSKVAEQVLPYARFLAKALAIPVGLLGVVDPDALVALADPARGRHVDTLVAEAMNRTTLYLETTARSFSGAQVKCSVEKGSTAEIVIEKATGDKGTLIVMATHGRSGMQRWLLGSVADKVLHGATNHLFLVRASDQGKTDGEAPLKTVIVPLDGSTLAEQVLPNVLDLTKKMQLNVVLMRAYALPPSVSAEDYGFYSAELLDHLEAEARDYLQEKVNETKQKGAESVVSVVNPGYGAEEIITLGRNTPDNFIAMSTHGRSGIQRWVLGSVTDRVVRHSGDPVLIVRSA